MAQGFGRVEKRRQKLEVRHDFLSDLNRIVPWDEFCSSLDQLPKPDPQSKAGRKPIGPLLLFKLLIIQQLYNLSDEDLEYQIHDRDSFRRFIDYDREMALVGDYKNSDTGDHEMIVVGRLSKLHGVNDAEFSLLVSDRFQRQGLGTELLRRISVVAQDENLDRVTAQILPENWAMQRVCEKAGFQLQRSPGLTIASIQLNQTPFLS